MMNPWLTNSRKPRKPTRSSRTHPNVPPMISSAMPGSVISPVVVVALAVVVRISMTSSVMSLAIFSVAAVVVAAVARVSIAVTICNTTWRSHSKRLSVALRPKSRCPIWSAVKSATAVVPSVVRLHRLAQPAMVWVRFACNKDFSQCSKPVLPVAARARSSLIRVRSVAGKAEPKKIRPCR